ncbi:MAG: glycine--tRNA ligase [Nanoarchaeota archaeon]|nr:glycine--tRNA ligase [Nanoarchaeota archaeon]MBU1269158.1 glycine--tRNA ligase [Nanoarchaeota archaeon]MBU1603983.1 glycine--tRNA ligase [Nanoarchaeota archaeon]MBU2443868.1 glycine--tRNA ligase [Nanoarchaeota archaeon]
MTKQFMQELISFMQQKGFIWGPTPEIYGGLAGFYTYAPLGKMLKNNIENVVRDVFFKNDFLEVECPTIMPKIVWEASGHLGGFTDAMITCKKCKSSFKAEQLLQELFPDKKITSFESFLSKNNVKCPSCQTIFDSKVEQHNLMMKTVVGIGNEAYNRPETATTTYLEFLRYYDFFRKKLPFGVFQIGNAYRNEISPRQHLLRTREFTQAEAQLFIFKDQKNNFPKFDNVQKDKLTFWAWELQSKNKKPETISLEDAMKRKFLKNKVYAYMIWLTHKIFLEIGIPEEKIRLTQHSPDEKAFYADDAWDVEVNLNSFGWTEICGVHDRTDYDLKQHAKFSKTNMEVLDEQTNEKKIPHILEIAFGTGRLTFAVLDLNYDKKSEEEGKTILKLSPKLTPFKVAVYPLLKKPELTALAEKIFTDLNAEFLCKYDEKGSIGKRYLRASEEGTPYVVTVDFDSLEKKDVTIRDRDTENQVRVKISDLKETLKALIYNKQTFVMLNKKL